VLVNAHPIFEDAAYAAGCINEPLLDETSSLELQCMQLRVLPAAQQPEPSALTHWETFAIEYPEVTEKQLWFITLREPLIATDGLPHQLWFVTLREPLIATDGLPHQLWFVTLREP
jgi:hypothetical protein